MIKRISLEYYLIEILRSAEKCPCFLQLYVVAATTKRAVVAQQVKMLGAAEQVLVGILRSETALQHHSSVSRGARTIWGLI